MAKILLHSGFVTQNLATVLFLSTNTAHDNLMTSQVGRLLSYPHLLNLVAKLGVPCLEAK